MPGTSIASRLWCGLKQSAPFAAALWCIGVVGLIGAKTGSPSDPRPKNRPVAVAAGDYVSSDTCRSCHPGNYASWHASFHRTMTQVPDRTNFLPPIDGGIELTLEGRVYRLEREAGSYLVQRRAADATAFEPAREIVLLTGSHHQQNFWLATNAGRSLEAFPFGWLIEEKRWAPVGDTFLAPPETLASRAVAAGAWNGSCINCHTTAGQPRQEGSVQFDSNVAEFGISCEACHAEGKTHIEQNRNPLTRYLAHLSGRADPSIANPARMKGPAAALACGQCHSIWAFNSAVAQEKWNQQGPAFRPGQSELPERFVAQSATRDHAAEKQRVLAGNPHFFSDSYWGDGMVRVTGREFNGVQLSPCFKGGAFSCLSCHEMHPKKTDRATLQTWAASQMKSEAQSDQACLQCHAKIGASISSHTHHSTESVGSRCYDCHMPHSSFGLLQAVRSHQVSSPSVAESIRWGRPNACNLCHLDRSLAWTAEKLSAWYQQPPIELERDDHEIAAGAKWLLKGDAGQRATVAWSMGWAPAQKAAGREWFAPYLAVLLNDPYAAVRFAAWKSLRTLPGFEQFSYDYTAPDAETFEAGTRALQQSIELTKANPQNFPSATLLDSTGRFDPILYERLLNERDNRRVYLVE
jgi:nitrate/TMAO reductase-like tetraheme cytochrome c subunit